ncbi:MAG: transcription termination factor Rho [Marmoricola sp.]|nr:transcription termination factor Rho [Marmoricola sp.]
MTETTESAPGAASAAGGRKGGGLNAMLLPELKQLAGGLGIKATGMRKGALIEAIQNAQSGGQSGGQTAAPSGGQDDGQASRSGKGRRARNAPNGSQGEHDGGGNEAAATQPAEQPERSTEPDAESRQDGTRAADRQQDDRQTSNGQDDRQQDGRADRRRDRQRGDDRQDGGQQNGGQQNGGPQDGQSERHDDRQSDRQGDRRNVRGDAREGHRPPEDKGRDEGRGDHHDSRGDQRDDHRSHDGGRAPHQGGSNRANERSHERGSDDRANDRGNNDRNPAGGNRTQDRPQPGGNRAHDDDGDGSRRNRRRRGRDRNDRQPISGGTQGPSNRGNRNEPDMQVLDDDVLAPCAGILDTMDNYAFVRTSGYLPGNDDVYMSMSMVRKFGLRRGDAITGQVRQPREGERKEKYNPLVKLDSVNGADPEEAKARVEFSKLTPLYPSERLRLETTSTNLIGRVIDIAAPIGKGQRGLIVSPSKAGKTMIMQSIANSITTNNPECHLMVVLVDERPEEVTDFERSVKGEVVSSTFDRPASDHTIVAELAIERAKRLVELGHDVVVLLDGITRLGRAYNLAAPASGRILSGGVDSAALYPPKRFFGAARNIEDGGSLTILATALIESGSKMDEVIFEEFKGTGNMEIRLRRDFADKRIFPAIDAVQSGTRREELLMSKEELSIVWKLRRVLSGLDGQQALELLLERLKKSQNNLEFLMQVQKTTPTAGGQGD